jgi:putative transposase
MEQRLEFILCWTKREMNMAELCRRFGVSRKTGYYWLAHFQADGLDGLKPHSRAALHHPNAIADEVQAAVVRAKATHPSWGTQEAHAAGRRTSVRA